MYSQIVRPNKSKCSWPNLYYDTVDRLIRSIGAKRILEVGVAYGYHAEHLLDTHNLDAYTGIDPYKADYDEKDAFCTDVHVLMKGTSRQASMDKLYQAVHEMLQQKKGSRDVTLLRTVSSMICHEIPDESLDFVFVDGSHLYQDVLLDLEALWPKVRNGGILSGDDFLWADVERAVREFAKKYNVQFTLEKQNNYPIFVFKK
jgi:predicted O-methyltransferase YrrM